MLNASCANEELGRRASARLQLVDGLDELLHRVCRHGCVARQSGVPNPENYGTGATSTQTLTQIYHSTATHEFASRVPWSSGSAHLGRSEKIWRSRKINKFLHPPPPLPWASTHRSHSPSSKVPARAMPRTRIFRQRFDAALTTTAECLKCARIISEFTVEDEDKSRIPASIIANCQGIGWAPQPTSRTLTCRSHHHRVPHRLPCDGARRDRPCCGAPP